MYEVIPLPTHVSYTYVVANVIKLKLISIRTRIMIWKITIENKSTHNNFWYSMLIYIENNKFKTFYYSTKIYD